MYNIYIYLKKCLYKKKYKGTYLVQRYKEEKNRPQTVQIRRLPCVPVGTKRYKGSKKRYITGRKPRKYVVYLCTPVCTRKSTKEHKQTTSRAFIGFYLCPLCVYLCVPLCTGAGTQQFILLMQHIPCTLVTGALGNEYI